MAIAPATTNSSKKAVKKPRRITPARYHSFRLQRPLKAQQAPQTPIKSSFKLLASSIRLLAKNWKLFGGIMVVYAVCTLVFVQAIGGGSADITDMKHTLLATSDNQWAPLVASTSLFVYLVGSLGGSASATASGFQLFFLVTTSLALIWALREVFAGKKVRIRDSFYRGMYPLVPFILVALVICLQLLPVIIGGYFYNLAVQEGIAATVVEKLLWLLIFILTAILSLYLISSSLFAAYIVCLPDMTPLRALRAARDLVRFRRLLLIRRIVMFPLLLLLGGGLLIIPLILWLPPLAAMVLFVVSIGGLALVHTYLYQLYRELL